MDSKGTEREIRFEALFEQSPFSMQLLDAHGRTLRVNKAWEALWVPPGAAGLKEWVLREYNVLEDAQLEKKGITAQLKRAYAGESVELPAIRYDPAELGQVGHIRWVRGYAHPVRDADGQIREVMLIHEDVSGRVSRDEAVRESEARLKQLANTIPQLAWMAHPDGNIHWYNDRWYEYTGTQPADMAGWGWQRVHHPKELPWVIDLWKRSLSTGEPFQMTFPLRARDGSYRPFFTLVAPLKDEQGTVVQWFGTNTDVSALEEAQRNLRATEERLRTAILAGNIGIWEWNLETGDVKWSDELYGLYGLDPEPGERREFLSHVLPEDRVVVERRARAAVERGDGFSAEYRGMLPNGELRWLSSWARFLPAQEGGPRRMIGATISIDAHKKAEAALREGDRRKDEFLAMLAHELRNPLSPISSAAEVLRMGADADHARRASEVIGRQVRHITKLMDDLLDVSRVTRGLVHLDRQPVEISSVLHSAIEQASPLLDEKGHTLSTTVDAPRAVVMGDRARLVQIVVNLLNNAARYTPNGGRIDVSLHANDEVVTLRVADSGQGIEPELLPHIFELFTQGKRSPDRAQGGLGMGLALVQRLAELHGGSVEAQSAGPGRGSAFSVDLPLAESAVVGEAAPSVERPSQPGQMRVTVVDDNRDAADSLATLLSMAGYEVEVHYDGRSALSSKTLSASQAFVLDIGLPDMDGYALARELRQRGIDRVLIALTGYGQPPDREASRQAGFDHHIVKPVEWTVLAELLRESAGGG